MIPYLSYNAIAKITRIPINKIYKSESESNFTELERARLKQLRADMEQIEEKYKLWKQYYQL